MLSVQAQHMEHFDDRVLKCKWGHLGYLATSEDNLPCKNVMCYTCRANENCLKFCPSHEDEGHESGPRHPLDPAVMMYQVAHLEWAKMQLHFIEVEFVESTNSIRWHHVSSGMMLKNITNAREDVFVSTDTDLKIY